MTTPGLEGWPGGAEAYPEIDVSPMRKELKTLFDLKEIA